MKTAQDIAKGIALAAFLVLVGALADRPIAEKNFHRQIEDCATFDHEGVPKVLYEDGMGNAYYVHRDSHRMAMLPPRSH